LSSRTFTRLRFLAGQALGCTVVVRGLEQIVDLVAQGGVVAVQADAVRLRGERLADDLELVGPLGGEALEDRVVGGDGVDLAGQ
jgi:hypothetical protein